MNEIWMCCDEFYIVVCAEEAFCAYTTLETHIFVIFAMLFPIRACSWNEVHERIDSGGYPDSWVVHAKMKMIHFRMRMISGSIRIIRIFTN